MTEPIKANQDVLVISIGTAGHSAAFDLVEAGYRVAIAEKSKRLAASAI